MLVSFQRRFKTKIENGSKIFTLRKQPKRDPKIGEQMHMYSENRTKNSEFICNHHILKSKQPVHVKIKITKKKRKFQGADVIIRNAVVNISVNGIFLSIPEIEQFVIYDGFDSVDDFIVYWTKNLKENVNSKMIKFCWTDHKY